DANFVTRSLTFNTTNTQTSTNWAAFTAAPELNLTGTLTYAPGTNSFAGTVTSATLTGDSTGQFYGPNAEELGGVFFLKGAGVETYAGAYGAVRPTAP
ncbi:MAG TPA: transferrin-binding protein-like solute binding protein, partial [Thiobacillus sp.]|nr:transferrin-binding protein-like solute binding protein [Thiobacillus sp.]